VEKPDTYYLTYTAKDKSGNSASELVRKVLVQDTLKPVIALKYGNQLLHKSTAADKGLGNEANPAARYNFMSEQVSGNSYMIGAVAAAALAGLALMAVGKKEEKLSVLV